MEKGTALWSPETHTHILKSQLILVNVYFVLARFQIKTCDFPMVFTKYVQCFVHILVPYLLEPI